MQMIFEPPYFFKPSGRPILFDFKGERVSEGTFGAHNTILEQIRINGWYSGIVISIILFSAVVFNTIVYRWCKIPEIKSLSIAVIVTGTYGAMVGTYVLGGEIGFLIPSIAGITYSFYRAEKKAVHVHSAPAKQKHCNKYPNNVGA